MNTRIGPSILLVTLALATPAGAQDVELEEGAALLKKECMVCHGSAAREVGARVPAPLRQAWLYAALQADQATLADIPAAALPAPAAGGEHGVAPRRFATLRAESARRLWAAGVKREGFSYSDTQQMLKGMEWNEATLDVFSPIHRPGYRAFTCSTNRRTRTSGAR